MKRYPFLCLITLILAFCSIVYELILAQSLSAVLENTVLRYSITIALYMFSMGVGSLFAEGRFVKNTLFSLLKIEILLTVIGGFSVCFLHFVDSLGLSRSVFGSFAYVLIVLIGVLTGAEIPILIKMTNEEKENSENIVLAIDYGGAFLGTLVFAFLFYPKIGLIPTAFFVGSLNAFGGILLFTQRDNISKEMRKSYYVLLIGECLLFIAVVACLIFSSGISEYFINLYLLKDSAGLIS